MAVNKVVYDGNTLVDLTADTVTASKLLASETAHGADGELITGTMTNRGAVTQTLTPSGNNTTSYTIPAGYHNGSGKVTANGATAYTAGKNSVTLYNVTRAVRGSSSGSSSIIDTGDTSSKTVYYMMYALNGAGSSNKGYIRIEARNASGESWTNLGQLADTYSASGNVISKSGTLTTTYRYLKFWSAPQGTATDSAAYNSQYGGILVVVKGK